MCITLVLVLPRRKFVTNNSTARQAAREGPASKSRGKISCSTCEPGHSSRVAKRRLRRIA